MREADDGGFDLARDHGLGVFASLSSGYPSDRAASLGPIDTDKVMGNSGATHGTVSTFPAMPAPPSLPPATAGTTAVTLNSGASKTLAAGAYGSVTVNSGAKLSLTGGTYVFSSLTLNSGGTLSVSAATTISVTGSASFNSGSYAGPAAGSGLTAKSLVMYFDGSSGINLNSGAQVQALLLATNALVTVNTSSFTGALAAAQVVMNPGATITCQDGFGSLVTTNLCAGVTCTASDQCHTPGTCDPTSGTCSNPVASNGTACNDGNACTTGETCQAGACVGGAPVTCTASDSCHLAGTCTSGDGGTGGCSNPVAASGTACSVGSCGGSCNAAGTCVEAVAAQNACFTSTCSPDAGVVNGPSSCVPTLNGTVATNLASMVGGGAVSAAQASLVRGRVLGLPEATPLAAVTVSILGHPEYTPSITGADGTYAIAVKGGALLAVVYAGPAGGPTYLPVQRHTPTRWQQYAVIPDVYLTPVDPNATDVALGSSTWQSASGSTITDPADQNGVDAGPPVLPSAPHTARLFFPAGTTASFTYGGCGSAPGSCGAACTQGSCVSGTCTGAAPASLTVRLTEYTVGATGQAAMPAELPPSTAYTYAMELSADEALSAGATGVSFNQAVSFYVDDFLGFGPAQSGTANPAVPVGFYDRATGQWIPSPNGAILEVTGFTGSCPGAGCVAVLNEPTTDAGTVVTLSADELAFLGQTYGARPTPLYLWRIQTTHFSGGDLNWPADIGPGATGPTGGPSGPPNGPDQTGGGGGGGGGGGRSCSA